MAFRQDQFRRLFQPDVFLEFRRNYEGINPDRPLETSGIGYEETEPLLRAFVNDTPQAQSFVSEFLPQLGTFLQGPFPLPGRRITRSAWDCRGKAGAYKGCGIDAQSVRGKRTLDIGCNAGYDTFYMNALGAAESVGLEPHLFHLHAMFLNAVYDRPGVSFFNAGWADLDRTWVGDFDWVSCLGLIYHIREPMNLLDKIASVMRPGARLLMETHVLSETSKQACFIEDAFWGDETYWWIFGDQCLMGMLRSSGFRDVRMMLKADCDSRNPDDPRRTVEGHPAGARAWFTATRA
jgi:tRNA (mo5U34)-methyltransferase